MQVIFLSNLGGSKGNFPNGACSSELLGSQLLEPVSPRKH